ncbi:hypothetical protein ACWGNE_26395 [Streptomyces xiamenensis]
MSHPSVPGTAPRGIRTVHRRVFGLDGTVPGLVQHPARTQEHGRDGER